MQNDPKTRVPYLVSGSHIDLAIANSGSILWQNIFPLEISKRSFSGGDKLSFASTKPIEFLSRNYKIY